MHKRKNEKNLILIFLIKAGHITIAIGSATLFLLELLAQLPIWIGLNLLNLVSFFFEKTKGFTLISRRATRLLRQLKKDVKKFARMSASKAKTLKNFKGRALSITDTALLNLSDLLEKSFHQAKGLLVRRNKRLRLRPGRRTPRWSLFNKFKFPIAFATLRHRTKFFFLLACIVLSFISFFSYQSYVFLKDLPNPSLLASREIPLTSKIYDRNGILLYQFYHGQNRTIVRLKDLPPHVIAAHIAIEDKNFYNHFGFDPHGIVRAVVANSNGNINQGASTITQQLIRMAFLSNEKTLIRKIREIILAFWAERLYTKDQILTMYLNEVPYGGEVYGVEAAAQTYFGKHAKDLSIAEAALLAGLPSAPSIYSPFGKEPQLARVRQYQVLAAMVEQGDITPKEEQFAKKENLKFSPMETEIKAPHFVMYVKEFLTEKLGKHTVEQGGLSVITSLDYPTYEKVLQIVQEEVNKQRYLNVGNGAALVTNPQTGEILAMVGSTNFFDISHDGNVNVTTANRSPGSSIKPLNYALAFERGIITPATIIEDKPLIYRLSGQPAYAPQNYDNRFHGKVSARVALASSYNIPAVKVLEKNGLNNFIDFATKIGLTTLADRSRFGLALTLGGGEVKMTDMAQAYSTFANAGVSKKLNPILKIYDHQGNDTTKELSSFSDQGIRAISPQSAFIISNILSDDSARALTFGLGSYLNIPGHTIAVKTGTTETKRDNWTIGYSFGPNPRLVAVWVGNNDNSPMSPYLESGNTGAAAIWNPIMKELLKDQPNHEVTKSSDIVAVQICSINGLLPCNGCPYIRTEYFIRGTEPKVACEIKEDTLTEIQKIFEEERKRTDRRHLPPWFFGP